MARLINQLPPKTIKYDCKVTAIDWNSSAKVKVTCENGRKFAADHVIFTGSMGFLKKNMKIFNPSLPERKAKAIETIGFGAIGKVYLVYENPFWDENFRDINLMVDHKVIIFVL